MITISYMKKQSRKCQQHQSEVLGERVAFFHPRLFRDVQTWCSRKAYGNTEGHGLQKVNALHNVCKQDQNQRPNGSPKVFTMSGEALRRSGILAWPWQEDCYHWHWMWILDCRRPAKHVGGTCLGVSVTLCIILSVQQMPVFRISMRHADTVPALATVPTLSCFSRDLRCERARDASLLQTQSRFCLVSWQSPRIGESEIFQFCQKRWALLIIGCTPKFFIYTEGSRFQVICARCELLYYIYIVCVPQVLLDADLPVSQISRQRALIWNDSLPTAEECARLFKTNFTLKEVEKSTGRFGLLFLKWTSLIFLVFLRLRVVNKSLLRQWEPVPASQWTPDCSFFCWRHFSEFVCA